MENIEEVSQKFIDDYKKIVDKHGLQLAASPSLKARDDGTFSIVVNLVIVPVVKK